MSPANFMVAPAARRARLVSGLANGIARERRAPAERPKGMGGRAQAAAGIVAHRPEDVKKPGIPAAMSVGPGVDQAARLPVRPLLRMVFGKTVRFYLN